jgi:hypothetical protein
MKSLKLFVFVLVAATMLVACSGVSQEQFDAQATQVAGLQAQLAAQAPTSVPTQAPTLAPTQEPTVATLPQATPVATATAQAEVEQAQVEPGNPGACPTDGSAILVWPGYNSPNDLNRLSAGSEWVSVCFPNGGGVLASYIVVEGKTFDDVLKCDRDNKPTEICGYLLNVPKGIVVKYHDGVAGTIFPDANGELYGPDAQTMHPWLREITAEVFPLPAVTE